LEQADEADVSPDRIQKRVNPHEDQGGVSVDDRILQAGDGLFFFGQARIDERESQIGDVARLAGVERLGEDAARVLSLPQAGMDVGPAEVDIQRILAEFFGLPQ
jgi:hypothetical protein